MNEEKLFNLLKTKLIPDLKQSTFQYSYTDAYSTKLNLTIELKCRNEDYDELLIEKDKYDKLMEADRCRYICSTPSGVYSFNLKKIRRPWWEFQLLPETTAFGRTQLVEKSVGYIPIKNGKNLTKVLLS